ncbi:MAG: M1 family metallopeptidase [Elusimicrobia bacterium]|nr:M1 family metallopeptidase [Elusimicrobiota bacterium]
MRSVFEELGAARCGRACAGFGEAGAGPDIQGVLLGKEPRYAPDRSFDTLHVKLALTVDFRRREVRGVCTSSIRAIADGVDRLPFDAIGLAISRVWVQGRPARFQHDGKVLTVQAPHKLEAFEEADVAVAYSVRDPKAGLHFVYPGPHNPANPVQLWSQGQPEESRYWFPCHDAPHEKATSELLVTVPAGFVAVSNGVLLDAKKGPRASTYHYRMHQPHSLYLITLTVGRFAEVRDQWEHIPVLYYCEEGREADARRGFGKTPKALEFFSKVIGVRYPYEKYAQIAVAEYPGGMENTTATTQTDACLIDKRAALDTDMDLLVAHELAHQWFGDLVTCRDWSHAWLNEGFATYFETLFTQHDKGQDEFDYELYRNRQAYFDEDEHRYRRPIVSQTFKHPWVLFDRHLYEKGGWVLHMLRAALGERDWWRAIQHYIRRHQNQSVATQDLVEAIEEATGRNLRPFFDRWVFQAGYPSFRVQYDYDDKARSAKLWVQQTQRVSEDEPLFKPEVAVRFEGRGWSRDFRKRVDHKDARWEFRLPGEPLNVEFDPEHVLLKKLDFRKPYAMWEHQLLESKTALNRIFAAHEVYRWGHPGALRALRRAFDRETFWGAKAEYASCIGRVRTKAALAEVERLARTPHPKVRRAAIGALAEFPASDAARLAVRALGDRSIHVVAEAARVLGSLKDPRQLGHVRRQLKERSYMDVVQSGAIMGLAATRDPSRAPELWRCCRPPFTYPARAYAVRSLSQFSAADRRVVGWLSGLLADPDERVVLAAVSALGRTEDERAIPALERLRGKTENSRVKTYCEESLARIRQGSEPKKKPSRRQRS